MPNHITNIVKITWRKDKVEELQNRIKSDNSEFDFNNIIKMPEELVWTRCPMQIISEQEYEEQEKTKSTTQFYSKCLTLKLSNEYKKNFWTDNWYDWSVANWWTKWNAYEFEVWVPKDNKDWTKRIFEIIFETARSTPEEVFIKLAELFPDLVIEIKYADEDTWSNCWELVYKDWQLLVYTNREWDRRFANMVHRKTLKKEKVN